MPETLSQHVEKLAPHFTFMRPEGDGPYATVILLHGCGGRKRLMDTWGEVVVSAGAAALIVDSYAPRGIGRLSAYSTVCTGARLQGRERAGDLFAAYAWALAHPEIDSSRIVAAGWSHGGWTVLDALALRTNGEAQRATRLGDLPEEPLAGLAGAFVVYPYAGRASFVGRRPWRIAAPMTAIVCGRDSIVGRKEPLAALERLRAGGAPIETHLFETATHAFDEPEAVDLRVRYDEALKLRAQDLLRGAIAKVR